MIYAKAFKVHEGAYDTTHTTLATEIFQGYNIML